MKIIEALKKVKQNKEKVQDLLDMIQKNSAHMSHESSAYDNPKERVAGWVQSCLDLHQENVRLLTAIQRTNLATPVTIELGGKEVTKNIAEWVWRRREYASLDLNVMKTLTDKGLRDGHLNSSSGEPIFVKLMRNYDVEYRDKMIATFRSEPHLIDAKLEVVNATTDLIESLV